jgi:ATP synthase protein I
LFGSGIQLAAAVAVFFFIGRWLDGKFGSSPWLMLTGAVVGAAGGMYRFIKTALDIDKPEPGDETAKKKSTQ